MCCLERALSRSGCGVSRRSRPAAAAASAAAHAGPVRDNTLLYRVEFHVVG
jgi:hypothetical protein